MRRDVAAEVACRDHDDDSSLYRVLDGLDERIRGCRLVNGVPERQVDQAEVAVTSCDTRIDHSYAHVVAGVLRCERTVGSKKPLGAEQQVLTERAAE